MDWIEIPEILVPGQKDSYDSVLTTTCRATTKVTLMPCTKKQTASELAEVFHHEVVRHHGLPNSIVHDRDKIFMGYFLTTLCKNMGVKPLPTSAFHPQTNGQAERTNQTFKTVLRTIIYDRMRHGDWITTNWHRLLDCVEIAINNAPIALT